MRVYGRIPGSGAWTVIETAPDGNNDAVRITQLIQVLKLNLHESPMYADWGIPAQQSIVTQIYPNFYASQVQARFAPFFSSLIVTAVPNQGKPVYNIFLTTNAGYSMEAQVPR